MAAEDRASPQAHARARRCGGLRRLGLRTLLAALLTAAAGPAAWAAAKSGAATFTLRTAAEHGGAPKWLQHGPHMHSGFCADVIAALNQRGSGLKIQLVEQALPQKRLLQQVKSGELDLLCALTHTEERDQDFIFVQPELYNMPYVLLARADDPVEVRSWDALRALGEQGLVLLNYDSSRLPLLQAKGGLHLHARGLTTEANLRMLLAGRGRFFYFPLSNAWYAVQHMGVQHQVRVLLPALQSEPYHLLARRNLPKPALDQLSQGLQQLRQQGELARLAMKWFGADLPAELRQALPQP
ncbi:MAG: transporter substrate-binding domain-containing protein [Paucibacter sp.]|nr:transporter substrate-binding domain-containing protein [Roseateles sp.]